VQLEDALQSTPPLHALTPQVTAQDPAPHLTPVKQADAPHSTVHEFDVEQSTSPLHVPSPQVT
jgi:hypothetical protein